MNWKEFFKIDKLRVMWFFLSIPLSALLSLLLFILLEAVFRSHIPIWFYIIFSLVISYLVGYIVDNIHHNLEEKHHKAIFYTTKALVIVASIIMLLVLIWGFFAMTTMTAKKPAVYLYPEQDSIISVELDINGKITEDIPPYNDGWRVFVTKEGIIENKYDYLFYEADLRKLTLPKEGWIVKYSELESWFDTNLRELGLNDKETSQFKEYWLEELPKSNYYEIKLLDNNFLKNNMNLIINPEPETMIRLNFNFKPLNEVTRIKEPTTTTPKRTGFTVVEWGGILEE
jgi:hypothetical protein